jgi:hypothetical protein
LLQSPSRRRRGLWRRIDGPWLIIYLIKVYAGAYQHHCALSISFRCTGIMQWSRLYGSEKVGVGVDALKLFETKLLKERRILRPHPWISLDIYYIMIIHIQTSEHRQYAPNDLCCCDCTRSNCWVVCISESSNQKARESAQVSD